MAKGKRSVNLKGLEREDVRRRIRPRAAVVYEAIRLEGRDELSRSSSGLLWSGFGAGLSMGFSFLAEALLSFYVGPAGWKVLVTKIGYSVGFLIVVLGRQQLFTENTLTPVLQLLTNKNVQTLLQLLRLWGLVLAANFAGAMIFAALVGQTNTLGPGFHAELGRLGAGLVQKSFSSSLLGGVFAGWLIALMVWLLPFAETGRITVIFILTYLVGVAGFGHIIASSVEVFYMLFYGAASWWTALVSFFLPVLLGNTVGGVAFVAVINHAQVASELSEDL